MMCVKCSVCGKAFNNCSTNKTICHDCLIKNQTSQSKLSVFADKVDALPDMTPMNFNISYPTKLLIIRHGESLGNATRSFLGHTDLDLSERGFLQAQRTAEYLEREQIDVVYSSSLIRAYNTALPHAKIRGLEVIKSDELKEIYAGAWEGLKVDEIIEKYGEKFTVDWRLNFGTFSSVPSMESVPSLAVRILNEMQRIAKENLNKTILVASHAAAIRSFFGKISEIPADELCARLPFPTNASVTVVYFDGERLIPGEYSHDSHLVDI